MKSRWYTLFLVVWTVFGAKGQDDLIDLDFRSEQDNTMYSYLVEVASDITNTFMDGVDDLEDWKAIRSGRKKELIEMLGLVDVPLDSVRMPPHMMETGIISEEDVTVKKLYYESLPGLYVPANLYIPKVLDGPAPAILYMCGHAREQMAAAKYQGNARKFAQLGFVCLVIETIQYGEVKGEHWGTYARGWFHWLSRGYHPGGVEVWNEIRAIDLLQSLDEVDPDLIGATGPSGGGSQSWYLGALDERVACVAPVAGGETIEAEIVQRTVDEHCDCMMPHNFYQRDFADIGALIAPRPLLVAAPSRDAMFAIESVRQMHNQIAEVYTWYDASDRINMIETPGGHGDREELRPRIFAFFMKYLMGKDALPSEIGDIDMSEEALFSPEELKVFVDGSPSDNRTTTIQESFVRLASAPILSDITAYDEYKSDVLDFLNDHTFRHFPERPEPLDLKLTLRANDGAPHGVQKYSFVSEMGWRLAVDIRWRQPQGEQQPIILVLRNPEEDRWDSESFISDLDRNVSRAFFAARGIGETGWAANQQWHFRRAGAWTGVTLASMRVYDVLRCLEVIRSLPGVDPDAVSIAARGEMAVVAAYAALLDGNVETLIMHNPPATQDQPSEPDGSGAAIEMLNCLQVTDIAQVAGILSPTRVYLSGDVPQNYKWAEELVLRLRNDVGVTKINDLGQWSR